MIYPRLSRAAALFLAAATILAHTGVSAQPYDFQGRLFGTAMPDGIHLDIRLEWGGTDAWTTTPAGVDVYHRLIGSACGSWTRITDEPVPWAWQDANPAEPHLSFEVVDAAAQSGEAYVYQARAVDGARSPVPGDPDAFLGVATHGIALLGHGTLYGGPGGCGESGVQVVENCDVQCFPALRFSGEPDVDQYLNTNTTVLVYGVITDVIWFCQAYETVAHLYTATPSSCVTPVEETTWGSIKNRYR